MSLQKLTTGTRISNDQSVDSDRDVAPASLVIHRRSDSESTCIDVVLWDVCNNGFKIRSDKPLLFEERVTVDLSALDLKTTAKLGARVAWIRSNGDAWTIGLAFEQEMQDGFVEQLSSICQAQRRKVERKEIEFLAEAKTPGRPECRPIKVLDCSATGLRFSTSSSIEVGEPIMLVIDQKDRQPSRILAKAKWTQQGERGQLVGCEVSGISRDEFSSTFPELTGERTMIPKIRPWQRVFTSRAALALVFAMGWLATLKR